MSDWFPQLLQQSINALSLGSIYALIAIGYTMVYGIIGMINFAHGEIYMIGAYIGMIALTLLLMTSFPLPLVLLLAMLASILITALYGWCLERIAYRHLRKGNNPRLVALITAIGMSIFLQNYVQMGQGSRDYSVPNLLAGSLDITMGQFTVTFSYARTLIIVVTFIAMIGLHLFISNSRTGRACRACSEDIQMANLLGINTDKIVSFVFVLGALLAAVGGVLIGLSIGKINPFIGFVIGIKAFTAAVLGGIGSIPGAMFGGILLGAIETMASAFLPTEYKDIVSFGLLITILLIRPTGLLGKPVLEKV